MEASNVDNLNVERSLRVKALEWHLNKKEKYSEPPSCVDLKNAAQPNLERMEHSFK